MHSMSQRSISRRSLVSMATVGATASLATRLRLLEGAAAQDTTAQITWLTNSDWPLEEFLAGFHEAHPDVEVVPEPLGFDALQQQIQVRLGAKSETPDVISVDVPNTPNFGYNGWLAPLDDVFNADEKADMLESSIHAGSFDGKLLAAPVNTSTQLLYYNQDIWDEAGVTPPGVDERWTWEQLVEAAQQLTITGDDGSVEVWGFVPEQLNRIYQLGVLPASLGGKQIGDDGITVKGIIDGPEWVEAFTFYWKLFNEWKVGPQGDIFWPPDIFETGSLASFVGGPWNIRRFAESEAVTFNWGVSRHPYFAEGEPATPTGGWHIGINAFTKQMDAARKFVHYMATSAGNELWWRTGSGDMPALKSVLAKFETEPEFAEPPLAYLKTAADEATVNPVPRANTVCFLSYESILAATFQDIRNGSDPAAALSQAADRIQRECDRFA
jgi:ABC-type glycerol-3-phosphate transport system substrate-binding protein